MSDKKWSSKDLELLIDLCTSSMTNGRVVGWSCIKGQMPSGYTLKALQRKWDDLKINLEYVADEEVADFARKMDASRTEAFDKLRVLRKVNRNYSRPYNAYKEMSQQIVGLLQKKKSTVKTKQHKVDDEGAANVAVINDAHLNELIALTIAGYKINGYDFKIAAKRLQLAVECFDNAFKPYKSKRLLIVNCGDMLNSDRRLDEILCQATNRSKAALLSAFLMEQVLLDFNKRGYNIAYATVSGNESRIRQEYGYSDIMALDNYDHAIEDMLKCLFRGKAGISFIDGGNPVEKVISVAGQNILFSHGNNKQLSKANIDAAAQHVIGKYAQVGIGIDFIYSGHIHSRMISDYIARGSSLCGSNYYSFFGLQVAGRAGLNCGVHFPDGNRIITGVDLQCAEDVDGYDIDEWLEAYNAKSAGKCKSKKTIFEVII